MHFLKICTWWPLGPLPPFTSNSQKIIFEDHFCIYLKIPEIIKYHMINNCRLTYDPAGAAAEVHAPYFQCHLMNYIGHWCLDISSMKSLRLNGGLAQLVERRTVKALTWLSALVQASLAPLDYEYFKGGHSLPIPQAWQATYLYRLIMLNREEEEQ